MHQLGLTDLTAGLTGTPSHYPHQSGTHPSRIDTCYGDSTTVRVHEAAYGDLPPTGTGQGPSTSTSSSPTYPRDHPARRHPRTHTAVPGRGRPRRLAQV